MSSFKSELLRAASTKVGAPFQHHYQPENLCDGGRSTVNECMERGMDNRGYDCSGLVIRSLCDVLDIKLEDWPRDVRHSFQLRKFEVLDNAYEFEPGEILLIESMSGSGYRYNTHTGIHSNGEEMIHASGKSKRVERGTPMGIILGRTAIDIDTLVTHVLTQGGQDE